ncbi:MAG: hypothetical protein JJ896_07435 [Rhodothermales bacterium]|nr:hypothetical protein [Rhodothermales bacterium]MBO6779470.1 hypothetical protein [Rhodothermales bacterium]
MRFLPLVILLLCAGCRDFAVDLGEDLPGKAFRSFDVRAHVPFEISVGDEAYLQIADMTLSFNMVLADTRCPDGVGCEHPGKADILMDISRTGGDDHQIVLQIPGQVRTPYELNDFVQHRQERFQLLSLVPYPVEGTETAEADYIATIYIDR